MLENSYPIRTDLALESQERLQEDQADMRGIRVLEERRENGVIVSTVMIETRMHPLRWEGQRGRTLRSRRRR